MSPLLLLLASLPQDVRVEDEVRFEQRHPLGRIEEQARRYKLSLKSIQRSDPAGGEYDLTQESFSLAVPGTYEEGEPHGLLVWVSPGDDGRLPAALAPYLARQRLIAVGAHGAGNQRYLWYRAGLALDAVQNVSATHTIDAERVYVAGFSGGAKTACRLALLWPDVFDGCLAIGACAFYEDVERADGSVWPARVAKPSSRLERRTRRDVRHVLLIGERDPNHEHVAAVAEQMKKRRFQRLTFVPAPEVGHQVPTGEPLERALEALAGTDAETDEGD